MAEIGGSLMDKNLAFDARKHAALAGGNAMLGQALSGAQRVTPSDDVVAALGALNRAVANARNAGWAVDLYTAAPEDGDHDSNAIIRIVRATISREV